VNASCQTEQIYTDFDTYASLCEIIKTPRAELKTAQRNHAELGPIIRFIRSL